MKKNRRQVNSPIERSELILNNDQSVYHLALKNENLADTVIVVGDQDRVERISKHFDSIEFSVRNREFITQTGIYKGKRITALSTGIGADNIDIVVNELDAAVNIDPETRLPRDSFRKLNIVRIGTSGSLQKDIPVDSFLISEFGLGFDGVLNFYKPEFEDEEAQLLREFMEQVVWNNIYNVPYFVKADGKLFEKLSSDGTIPGITITANGFYGPQGRMLMLEPENLELNENLSLFKSELGRITNYEMETAALYGLSAMLGHSACTICAIIANRPAGEYSGDYKKTVDNLISYTLDRLTLDSE